MQTRLEEAEAELRKERERVIDLEAQMEVRYAELEKVRDALQPPSSVPSPPRLPERRSPQTTYLRHLRSRPSLTAPHAAMRMPAVVALVVL